MAMSNNNNINNNNNNNNNNQNIKNYYSSEYTFEMHFRNKFIT
jgi:hypothetical protein